jgi:hypothetical protein
MQMPSNNRTDCVRTYSGVGCGIGGGFKPVLPPNKQNTDELLIVVFIENWLGIKHSGNGCPLRKLAIA